MKGVGILPEGINNNPVTYELLLELVWHKDRVDVDQWIESYVTARYGRITDEIRTAWKMMLKSIYSSEVGYQEGPPENILCARPALELKSVSSWLRSMIEIFTRKQRSFLPRQCRNLMRFVPIALI